MIEYQQAIITESLNTVLESMGIQPVEMVNEDMMSSMYRRASQDFEKNLYMNNNRGMADAMRRMEKERTRKQVGVNDATANVIKDKIKKCITSMNAVMKTCEEATYKSYEAMMKRARETKSDLPLKRRPFPDKFASFNEEDLLMDVGQVLVQDESGARSQKTVPYAIAKIFVHNIYSDPADGGLTMDNRKLGGVLDATDFIKSNLGAYFTGMTVFVSTNVTNLVNVHKYPLSTKVANDIRTTGVVYDFNGKEHLMKKQRFDSLSAPLRKEKAERGEAPAIMDMDEHKISPIYLLFTHLDSRAHNETLYSKEYTDENGNKDVQYVQYDEENDLLIVKVKGVRHSYKYDIQTHSWTHSRGRGTEPNAPLFGNPDMPLQRQDRDFKLLATVISECIRKYDSEAVPEATIRETYLRYSGKK